MVFVFYFLRNRERVLRTGLRLDVDSRSAVLMLWWSFIATREAKEIGLFLFCRKLEECEDKLVWVLDLVLLLVDIVLRSGFEAVRGLQPLCTAGSGHRPPSKGLVASGPIAGRHGISS